MSTAIICCVCISIGAIIGFFFACICAVQLREEDVKQAYKEGYLAGSRDKMNG